MLNFRVGIPFVLVFRDSLSFMGFKGTPNVAGSDINHEYFEFPMVGETIHKSETVIFQPIRGRNKKQGDVWDRGVIECGLKSEDKEGIYKEKSVRKLSV
jgi:hypothetical protein